MERCYAFTDEYGAFGWNIDNPKCASLFTIDEDNKLFLFIRKK